MEQHNNPPSKYSYTEPYIIIGVDLNDDFIRHYKATHRLRNKDEFESVVKNIPYEIRVKISETYQRLRDAGWFPAGIDGNEKIIWRRAIVKPGIDDSPMPDVKEQVERIRNLKNDMIKAMPDADVFKDYRD